MDNAIPDEEKKNLSLPIPHPFVLDKKKVEAIVLGADPTNFTDNHQFKILDFVFGVGSDEPGYFRNIQTNLNAIGLHLEDLYIQNVVRNYLGSVTDKNKYWEIFADYWIEALQKELMDLDPRRNIPALITAESIMKYLVNDHYNLAKPSEIYSSSCIPVPANNNKLKRPLIPFYRHPRYQLSRNPEYAQSLKQLFH